MVGRTVSLDELHLDRARSRSPARSATTGGCPTSGSRGCRRRSVRRSRASARRSALFSRRE